jgi:hypothetical protein
VRERAVATAGDVERLDRGRELLADPTRWFRGPATIGAWGRGPA